jgi:hypothetical protein
MDMNDYNIVLIKSLDLREIDARLQLNEEDGEYFGKTRGEVIAVAPGLRMPIGPRQHHDRVELFLWITGHSAFCLQASISQQHHLRPARKMIRRDAW